MTDKRLPTADNPKPRLARLRPWTEHAGTMPGKSKKTPREKDLTSRYFSGNLDEDLDSDRVEQKQRFTSRSADAQQNKMLRTSLMRAADEGFSGDLDALPLGEVTLV